MLLMNDRVGLDLAVLFALTARWEYAKAALEK